MLFAATVAIDKPQKPLSICEIRKSKKFMNVYQIIEKKKDLDKKSR